ncbi:unnamed protein product, partial [Allacma fusca]
MLVSRTW